MDLRFIKTSNDVLANKGLIICPRKMPLLSSSTSSTFKTYFKLEIDHDTEGMCNSLPHR